VPCGACWYCARGEFNLCPEQRVFGYGAFLGDVNGGQADFVRVPNADIALHHISDVMTDEQALFAGDIFTAGYYCAQQAGIRPGDSVVVQGCGPVGLMAVQAAATFEPGAIFAVDTVPDRLQMAARFGAIPVNASEVDVPTFIQEHTGERGADVVLECVGAAPAMTTAIDSARSGGRVSVIGVYSEPEYELPINMVFVRGIELRFCGTANIVGCWDKTLELIASGRADPAAIISHRLPLSEGVKGYELFESREAMKVVLTP
jgi:threonine dehydrogenase-like Zn-dependent dehydrogenase